MYLQSILDYPIEEHICNDNLYIEESSDIYRFSYDRAKHDPRPRVLILGQWQNPDTGNNLVGGLNLNYLSNDEIKIVQKIIDRITKYNNLKSRYWAGRNLIPSIWRKSYRTYDKNFIGSAMKADFTPDEIDYKQDRERQIDPDGDGKPGNDSGIKTGSDADNELQDLDAIEKIRTGEEPKKQGILNKIARFSKSTLNKIKSYLINKLKKRKTDKVDKTDSDKVDDFDNSVDIENPDNIDNEDEVEEVEEDFDVKLDAILEEIIKPKKLFWNSPTQYVYWHKPSKFFEYQNKINGSIADYSYGSNIYAIFDTYTESLIIDLVDDIQEMYDAAMWNDNNKIVLSINEDKVNIESNGVLCEDYNMTESLIYHLFSELCK